MKFPGIRRLHALATQNSIWGPIEDELKMASALGLLRGRILNSGAGSRDVSGFVEGELINQDIEWHNESRTHIQIYSSAESVPVLGGSFDTVLSIAVLEHVAEPILVTREYFRVLKPGGHVVASVPFLQPEHKVPTDYQRWTRDGLHKLFTDQGFEVVSLLPLFTVFHTIHWILYETIALTPSIISKLLRYLILLPLVLLSRKCDVKSDVLASAFQIIAKKPNHAVKGESR